MFEAERWQSNPKYFSPMADINGEHVFYMGDFVHLRNSLSYAKVLMFLTEVCACVCVCTSVHMRVCVCECVTQNFVYIFQHSTGLLLVKVQEIHRCTTTNKYFLREEKILPSEQIGAISDISVTKEMVLTSGRQNILTDKVKHY